MDIQKIHQYKSAFDLIAKAVKDDDGNNIEVWYARELQEVLGYARWENFVTAVGRAIESCKTLGINVDDHFREVTKMVGLGSGSQRPIQDFMLMEQGTSLVIPTRAWRALPILLASTPLPQPKMVPRLSIRTPTSLLSTSTSARNGR